MIAITNLLKLAAPGYKSGQLFESDLGFIVADLV